MAIIRPRTEADFVSCVALLRDVHESAGYPVNWPDDPKTWLTPPSALGCWVVTVDGEVAGHVAVGKSDGAAIVERLFVDPKQTGQGLGRQLLDHAAQVAGDHELALTLEVADNCTAAIALYTRAGWRATGRTPIDWGGDQASAVINFSAPSS
ncbi:GNAT family N-acetyltransferase [Kribbella sp. DT2]|uniref:GNAT family N-acetyltransferase n=1 Tax=Kribbella sp. DT2 TaxID=3393427 RepID=UPI003CF841DF